MLELVISDDAEQDLTDIWKYIAEDSPVNATRFLRKLAKKYHWLTNILGHPLYLHRNILYWDTHYIYIKFIMRYNG